MMKMNLAFSAFEYRNITPQSPKAETLQENENFVGEEHQQRRDYNDLNICNSAGVYKNTNGAGLFDNENQFINQLTSIGKNQTTSSILNVIDKGPFKIFPNPASTNITIAYQLTEKEHGQLIIFDALGREQLSIVLSSTVNKVIVNVQHLHKGVYTFKYVVNGINKQTGKLIIE